MSLIKKQDELVKQLEKEVWGPFFARGGLIVGDRMAGTHSKLKRLHAEKLMRDGYSKEEAWASAKQCSDVARLNSGHAHFLVSMGAQSRAEQVAGEAVPA